MNLRSERHMCGSLASIHRTIEILGIEHITGGYTQYTLILRALEEI
jgi:hypothetical protein